MKDKDYLEYYLVNSKRETGFLMMRLNNIGTILSDDSLTPDIKEKMIREIINQANSVVDSEYKSYDFKDFSDELATLDEQSPTAYDTYKSNQRSK